MSTTRSLSWPLLWASRALNEAVMGFLALVALGAAIGPLVFDVSPATERLLTTVEWIVLALFIVEFTIQFTVAQDRARWLQSPWRIVDAICIIGPLLSLLPQVSDSARGALGFRLLRVGRAVAFSARAGALAVQKRQDSGPGLRQAETRVTIVKPGERISATASSWPELLAWVPHQTPVWYHASSVTGDQLREIAHVAGLSAEDAEDLFNPVGQPRLKSLSRFTAIALWLPTVAEAGFPAVSRNRLFALVSRTGLQTATTQPFDLPQSVPTKVSSAQSEVPFAARTTYRVLELVPQRNQYIANRHEEEILRLEELRVTEGGAQFLNEAFRLQRELSTATADLWRFTTLVRKLSKGKLALEGSDAESNSDVDSLLSGSEVVLEKFAELKDSLKSLMELHMNVTSFEMNKFMKLLAIVGFLGLIPSVAGGLLGMNVAGNPWPVTLGQVAFGIAMGMAIALYVFAIKGWLR